MGNFGVSIDKFLKSFIEMEGYKTVLEGLKNTAIIAIGGLLIGQIIGRWGNFMNGEAFGYETDILWRMGIKKMLNMTIEMIMSRILLDKRYIGELDSLINFVFFRL